MDLSVLPFFQFAIPVVAVVACIFLVYAFGFKPTTTPAFTKIITEDDEDKQKVAKKAKTKRSQTKTNSLVTENHAIKPTVTASPAKPMKLVSNAEPKKAAKKIDRPAEPKTNEVSKKEVDDKDSMNEVSDDWMTAVSKKGRKNKGKKENGPNDEEDDSPLEVKKQVTVADNNNNFLKLDENMVEKEKQPSEVEVVSDEFPDQQVPSACKVAEVLADTAVAAVSAYIDQSAASTVPHVDACFQEAPEVLVLTKKKRNSDKRKNINVKGDNATATAADSHVSSVNAHAAGNNILPVLNDGKIGDLAAVVEKPFATTSSVDLVTSALPAAPCKSFDEPKKEGVVLEAVGQPSDDFETVVASKTSKKKKKNADNKKHLQNSLPEPHSAEESHLMQVVPTIIHHQQQQPTTVTHEINYNHLEYEQQTANNIPQSEVEPQSPELQQQLQPKVEAGLNQLSDGQEREHVPSEVWEEAKPQKKKKKVQKI